VLCIAGLCQLELRPGQVSKRQRWATSLREHFQMHLKLFLIMTLQAADTPAAPGQWPPGWRCGKGAENF